jgi:hypothetical protein
MTPKILKFIDWWKWIIALIWAIIFSAYFGSSVFSKSVSLATGLLCLLAALVFSFVTVQIWHRIHGTPNWLASQYQKWLAANAGGRVVCVSAAHGYIWHHVDCPFIIKSDSDCNCGEQIDLTRTYTGILVRQGGCYELNSYGMFYKGFEVNEGRGLYYFLAYNISLVVTKARAKS